MNTAVRYNKHKKTEGACTRQGGNQPTCDGRKAFVALLPLFDELRLPFELIGQQRRVLCTANVKQHCCCPQLKTPSVRNGTFSSWSREARQRTCVVFWPASTATAAVSLYPWPGTSTTERGRLLLWYTTCPALASPVIRRHRTYFICHALTSVPADSWRSKVMPAASPPRQCYGS